MSADHIRCTIGRQAYKCAQIKIILMQNLFDFHKDIQAYCSAMNGDQLNHFFINVKFIDTGPDQDSKLCYPSDIDGLVNCNRKCSNLNDSTFNCCFKSLDISSSRSTTVFLFSEISLNKCTFSGHTILTVFTRHCFTKSPSV